MENEGEESCRAIHYLAGTFSEPPLRGAFSLPPPQAPRRMVRSLSHQEDPALAAQTQVPAISCATGRIPIYWTRPRLIAARFRTCGSHSPIRMCGRKVAVG